MTDQFAAGESGGRPGTPDGTVAAALDAGSHTGTIGSPPGPGDATRRRRVSRWDRPPEPHDWRFFVSNLGKVLIATGLLMFGFVAYQLWGTGIETARAQSQLKDEFRELISERQTGTAQTDGDPATGPDLSEPVASIPAPGSTPAPDDEASATVVDRSTVPAPSADPVGPAEGDGDPVAQDIPPILRGDPLALLEIPAIGRSDIVVPGVSLTDLKDGPGHYPDTPLPGQLGNAAIAGHRTTYGAPFFDVDDLVAGDELIVTMLTGDRFVYEVTGSEIVSASDYWVVATRDPSIAELTLTSCDPKYTARDRIVIHSVLNPAKSANVGIPSSPYFLEPDDAPIPGDDPVLSADRPVGDGPDQIDPSGDPDVRPATGGTQPDDGSDTASAEPDRLPSSDDSDGDRDDAVAAVTADPNRGAGGEVGDGFSQGWFDDRAAFSQIALWAIALSVISFGIYAISRRFRRYSIGVLIGVAPFLLALYFFYQNVNRLLPAGL